MKSEAKEDYLRLHSSPLDIDTESAKDSNNHSPSGNIVTMSDDQAANLITEELKAYNNDDSPYKSPAILNLKVTNDDENEKQTTMMIVSPKISM